MLYNIKNPENNLLKVHLYKVPNNTKCECAAVSYECIILNRSKRTYAFLTVVVQFHHIKTGIWNIFFSDHDVLFFIFCPRKS